MSLQIKSFAAVHCILYEFYEKIQKMNKFQSLPFLLFVVFCCQPTTCEDIQVNNGTNITLNANDDQVESLVREVKESESIPEAVPLHNLTLFYFQFRGRGEPIRLLLHYTGIQFNDRRISSREWLGTQGQPGFKSRTPFGHVPLIRLADGREMAESFAIMRMIARQNGLAGADPWESAKIDEFADFHKDAFAAFHDALSLTEQQVEEEDANSQAKFQQLLHQFMPIYQRQLRASPVAGQLFKKLSWVDFLVADFVESFRVIRPNALTAENWPELLELHRKVHGLPQLAAYLGKRKFTRY